MQNIKTSRRINVLVLHFCDEGFGEHRSCLSDTILVIGSDTAS